ncbi:hypothetical protein AB0M42_07910 [Streptomyces sp. NPDC051784]
MTPVSPTPTRAVGVGDGAQPGEASYMLAVARIIRQHRHDQSDGGT